jgi:HEAT repeat protein
MSSHTLQSLLVDLRHFDKNIRMDAALALGTLGDVEAVQPLVESLGSDQDFFVGETVTWALVRCGSTSVEPLIALLKEGSDLAKVKAAHALGKLGDAKAAPALIAQLSDENIVLREKCVMALGNVGGDEAKTALVSLLGSKIPELSTAITKSLESFGEGTVMALVARISDEDALVRAQVVDLLGFSGSAMAIPYLCAAANDEVVSVRLSVLTALGALAHLENGGISAVFESAMNDADKRVRLLAERLSTLTQ